MMSDSKTTRNDGDYDTELLNIRMDVALKLTTVMMKESLIIIDSEVKDTSCAIVFSSVLGSITDNYNSMVRVSSTNILIAEISRLKSLIDRMSEGTRVPDSSQGAVIN